MTPLRHGDVETAFRRREAAAKEIIYSLDSVATGLLDPHFLFSESLSAAGGLASDALAPHGEEASARQAMSPYSVSAPDSAGDRNPDFRGHTNEAFVGIHEDEVIGCGLAPTPSQRPGAKHSQPPNVTDKSRIFGVNGLEGDVAKRASDVSRREEGGPEAEKYDPDAKPAICTQVLGVVIASLTHFAIGTIIGLPGVTLPQLTDQNSQDIFLDTAQVALFGSLVHVGAMAGSLLGGVLNLRVGQRVTMLLALPFSLALWLGLSFSPSVWMVQMTRTLLGVTQGLYGAAAHNYVVEVAHTSKRGRFVGFVDTARQLGFLFAYIIGSSGLSWRHVALVCGFVSSVPPFVGLLFLPNSPRWLVTRGRVEEAAKALRFYRGQRYDLRPELSAITDQFEQTSTSEVGIKDQLRLIGETTVRRRLMVLTLLMFVLQFTGNVSIATYVVPILQKSKTAVNAYTSAMLVGGIRVVGTVAFLLFVDRVGRKAIVVATSIVCTATLVALGVYFYLQNRGADLTQVSWLPLVLLLVYMPFVCALEAVTCLFRGELLPTSVRAVGAALLYIVFFLGLFASAHAYPASVATIGEEGVFWIYAASCVLLAAAIVFWVPETRGLSLEQIDDFFRGKGTEAHTERKK